MAPPRNAFADHVAELLSPLGVVRVNRMFGGRGIYVDGIFIAIIASDRLFMKTDEATRSTWQAAGCEPFTYQTAEREVQLTSYWSAPAQALESSDDLRPWARLALEAALRQRAHTKPRAARKTKPAVKPRVRR